MDSVRKQDGGFGNVRPEAVEVAVRWIRGGTVVVPLLVGAAVLLQPWAEPVHLWVDPIQQAARLVRAERLGIESEIICCPYYVGAASQLGLAVWAAAAGICAMTALLLVLLRRRPEAAFFASAALIGAMLGLDDGLLLHDQLFPHIPGGKKTIFLIYGLFLALHLGVFGRRILGRHALFMIFSLAFFAFSMVVDVFNPKDEHALAEDMAKFFGICFWFGFHALMALDCLTHSTGPRAPARQ